MVNRVRTPDDDDRALAEIEARRDGAAFDSWTWLPYDEDVLAAEPSVEVLLSAPADAIHRPRCAPWPQSVTGIPTEAIP